VGGSNIVGGLDQGGREFLRIGYVLVGVRDDADQFDRHGV
jgi:hypothetical protein